MTNALEAYNKGVDQAAELATSRRRVRRTRT